jgi:hypothetical protein
VLAAEEVDPMNTGRAELHIYTHLAHIYWDEARLLQILRDGTGTDITLHPPKNRDPFKR